ncbi:MAG: leucine-rich repeat domain-containing protein [Promethearchaeota archaeon]|nr:MAG: leucine-rich repeat domain-containing protein [Candidatus Lokiarchaeota archaeon]
MNLTSDHVMLLYSQGHLDKIQAVQNLIFILDNSDNENERYSSLKFIESLNLQTFEYYQLLERLSISDCNDNIRGLATYLIGQKFIKNALEPMKWAIKNEKSLTVLISVIDVLQKISSNESKEIILKKLIDIINEHKEDYLYRYISIIKGLINSHKLRNLSEEQLTNILRNFLTILSISKSYPNFSYDLDKERILVSKLDLSDLELEPRGLPIGWKNNIKNIMEIIGLDNLKHLKKLNLSNNQLEHLKGLEKLQDLEYLNLSNNNISDINELSVLNELTNLRLLDLHGNKVVNEISIKNVKSSFKIILKTTLEELEDLYEAQFIKY